MTQTKPAFDTQTEPAFDLDSLQPGEDFGIARASFVLTAQRIMWALEGGAAACPRGECRKAGTCCNAPREKACAKKLSPDAQRVVSLMMLFAMRLHPIDIMAFYFGEELFAFHHKEAPMQFDEESRAHFWPLGRAKA